MKASFTLEPIVARTKGEVKRLRQAGLIPVSLQHQGMTTEHFQQEAGPLDEFIRMHGDGAMIDLLLAPDNRRQRAMVHDVQRDGMTNKLLQVTFQQIRHDDTLKTHVSLVFRGEPAAVTRGEAMVQHQIDRLDIECAQGSLPDHIVVDVAHLMPGEVVRVSDLPANTNYKILVSPNTVLASLTSTRAGGAPTTEAADSPSS